MNFANNIIMSKIYTQVHDTTDKLSMVTNHFTKPLNFNHYGQYIFIQTQKSDTSGRGQKVLWPCAIQRHLHLGAVRRACGVTPDEEPLPGEGNDGSGDTPGGSGEEDPNL